MAALFHVIYPTKSSSYTITCLDQQPSMFHLLSYLPLTQHTYLISTQEVKYLQNLFLEKTKDWCFL